MVTRLTHVPEWMTGEVEAALRQVGRGAPARQRSMMHATILRLAHARATQQVESTVFEMPDTCSRTTWYGRYREKGGVRAKAPGWADDPAVQRALQVATERAQRWEDTRISRLLTEARLVLVEASPAAARELRRQIGEGEKDKDRREASKAVLDRAGFETAAKGQQAVVATVTAAERIAAMRRAMEAGGEGLDGSDKAEDEA